MLLTVVIAESIAIALLMVLLAVVLNYAIHFVCSTTPLANYPDICASFSALMWEMYLILLIGVIAYIAICVLIALANRRQ
ncbi:MAG: hypothetical protein DRH17_14035 [Deltaproteobacteria bacterium]|nr:MAG: hypothetical protein DRH17_14035 [Deltaproteobacteria bacterium]